LKQQLINTTIELEKQRFHNDQMREEKRIKIEEKREESFAILANAFNTLSTCWKNIRIVHYHTIPQYQ
jgi:hypothetical protein